MSLEQNHSINGDHFLAQQAVVQTSPLVGTINSISNNTEIRNWCSITLMEDLKKLGKAVGYLTLVVVLKTGQRALTVMISSEGSMDWNELLKKINPAENILEFALTIPQLGISVLAIDVWKWGLENIVKTFNSSGTNHNLYTEIESEELIVPEVPESNFTSFSKLIFAKLGYWVPNHFMITASSMYSVKSLVSLKAYVKKLSSRINIASTFIRAEVLGFTSGFLKTAITNFGEISIIKSCLKDIAPLLKKLNFLENAEDMNVQSRVKQTLLTSLKISLYLIAMVSATVVDNANKTALVMYTAGKIDQFVPTFFTAEMVGIMIGLICIDTFGNKFCNVIAKDKVKKLWNEIKESFAADTQNTFESRTRSINNNVEDSDSLKTTDEYEQYLIQEESFSDPILYTREENSRQGDNNSINNGQFGIRGGYIYV